MKIHFEALFCWKLTDKKIEWMSVMMIILKLSRKNVEVHQPAILFINFCPIVSVRPRVTK